MVASDAQFVCDTLQAFTGGLIAPIQVAICVGLLWQHVGAYCFLGVRNFFFLQYI